MPNLLCQKSVFVFLNVEDLSHFRCFWGAKVGHGCSALLDLHAP